MTRLLTILIFFAIAYGASAQKMSAKNKAKSFPSTKPIFERLNYHRGQFNADSSLYYADVLVEFQKSKIKAGGIVSACFQKINTLNLFGKESEGFKLALTTYEEYCVKNERKEYCESCSYIYDKLADYMITLKDYEQGIRYLDMNTCKERNFYYKKATLYCFLNLNDSALTQTSNLIAEAYQSNNYWELMDAYNAHGLISKRIGKLDEAILAFNRALDFVDSLQHDPRRHAYVMGNLGSVYLEKGDLDLAYECLLIDSEGSLDQNQTGSYLMAEMSLIEIEVRREEYELAIRRINSLLEQYNNHLNDDIKLKAIEYLMHIYKSTGSNAKYEFYSNKWIELGKSTMSKKLETHQGLVQEYSANSLNLVKEQLATEKELSAQELLVLEKEQEKKQLRNWLITIGLILVIIIFLLFFLRWRSIAKVKEAQLKLSQKEQDYLALKVENESKNVQALSVELNAKKDFSKSLVDKLKDIENVSKSDVKNIELFIQNELDIKSTRADLQNQMGDLSGDFHSKLLINHPNLTDMDVKLAAMVVMNMSNKDIAISKNITPGSVRIAKNRLKKKLNLSEEIDLTAHLKGIL